MSAGGGESRLLARLEASIQAESDPVRAACLRAEWAGVQARQGREDLARLELATLRQQFAQRPHLEVSIWLWVAEGWLAHYAGDGKGAKDKLKRAAALARAANFKSLDALSSAWLAHFEFCSDAPDSMRTHLQHSLSAAEYQDHGALARACLVVAMSYDFGGHPELAQPWYIEARHHAYLQGDDVAVGALTRNMAALNVGRAQRASIFGVANEDVARYAMATTQSAEGLDLQKGNTTFNVLVPYLKACVSAIQCEYEAAIDGYRGVLPHLAEQGFESMRAQMLADVAWCLTKLGRTEEAHEQATLAVIALQDSRHVEDQLIAHGRLGQTFELLGDSSNAKVHMDMAEASLAGHESLQAKFVSAVAGLQRVAQSSR